MNVRMLAVLSCVSLLTTTASPLSRAPFVEDSQQQVRDYLTKVGFGADEIARLEAGEVIAAAKDGQSSSEMSVVAAVKIRTPRAQVASYYGQMIAYVDGEVTLAFGRFGSPPAMENVTGLAFDRDEIDQLKSCRPGRCDIRLGGAGLEALRSSIDWAASDYVARANAYAQKAAVDYVTAYQAQGDAALVTYDDRAQPVKLKDQWLGILANSPLFHQYSPELKAYLEQFPRERLNGARDVFYWIKENYGLKPVISIIHGVIYEPPAHVDRTIVAQKQLYASHYLDGSLAVATLLDTVDQGRPATYLVYANRSRGDLLKGGFGGMKRNVARSQARRAAEETLTTIKSVLEAR
jgi:hypothetical protein